MSANQVLGVMRILQGPAADEAIDKGVLRWKLSKFSQCPGWGPHLSQWCKLRHLARVSPAHGAAIVEGERDESSIDPAAGKSGFCAQGNHLRARVQAAFCMWQRPARLHSRASVCASRLLALSNSISTSTVASLACFWLNRNVAL